MFFQDTPHLKIKKCQFVLCRGQQLALTIDSQQKMITHSYYKTKIMHRQQQIVGTS